MEQDQKYGKAYSFHLLPIRASTPLKIRTDENSRIANTPAINAKGSSGAKNPFNGTLISANPASIQDKYNSGNPFN